MTRRLATQATALGLALVTTLAMLGGIHQLAAPEADAAAMAHATTAPAQVVVITGKRLPQG